MVSSIDSSFHVSPNFQQTNSQESVIPKTGSRDSDGDNDRSKPGEIEPTEKLQNNSTGNKGSIINLEI